MADNNDEQAMLVTLTADIASAHVSNNVVAVSDMPLLIGSIHKALSGLNGGSALKEEIPMPFVAIRNSVKPAHIVCLDCGEKLKMLKRHLNT
ncbi:MucR family transcriptional regulator, partial [Nostoc sp. CHAB 5836]|nr:MucR family transcriptional regulator [Nostoc sp. CHAB 5836]